MLYSALAFTAAALAGLASAQNYTTSGPLNVTASQIDRSLRLQWCTGQMNNCPGICGGRADVNTCDPDNLSYSCVCTNGAMPNISAYKETLPFYICGEWISNCKNNHPNDLMGLQGCESVQCGTMLPPTIGSVNTAASGSGASTVVVAATTSGASGAASSASMTTTTAAAAAGSGGSTSSSSSTSKGGAATAMAIAQNYGAPVLAAGVFAAFGLAL